MQLHQCQRLPAPTAQLAARARLCSCLFWRLGPPALGSDEAHTQKRRARCWRRATGGPRDTRYRRSSTSQFCSISCGRWRCALFPIANSRSASCLQQPGLRATIRTVEVGRAGALTTASNPDAGRDFRLFTATLSRINRATPSISIDALGLLPWTGLASAECWTTRARSSPANGFIRSRRCFGVSRELHGSITGCYASSLVLPSSHP